MEMCIYLVQVLRPTTKNSFLNSTWDQPLELHYTYHQLKKILNIQHFPTCQSYLFLELKSTPNIQAGLAIKVPASFSNNTVYTLQFQASTQPTML